LRKFHAAAARKSHCPVALAAAAAKLRAIALTTELITAAVALALATLNHARVNAIGPWDLNLSGIDIARQRSRITLSAVGQIEPPANRVVGHPLAVLQPTQPPGRLDLALGNVDATLTIALHTRLDASLSADIG
jgi:hypothetical protein